MDFKTDSWYYILTTTPSGVQDPSVAHTLSFNQGGVLSISYVNHSSAAQKWQLFPTSHSLFIFRTKASGPNGFLAAPNNVSVPSINNEIHFSSLWTVGPWGDGTFYLGNSASGKIRYLGVSQIDGMRMSAHVTLPHHEQAFTFTRAEKISNPLFSTVPTPHSVLIQAETRLNSTSLSHTTSRSTTARSFSTSVIPTSHTSTTYAVPTQSVATMAEDTLQQLSQSAAMGIGVTIGVIGIIILTAIGLFIYQKWLKRSSPEYTQYRHEKLWKGFTPQYHGSQISTQPVMDEVLVVEAPNASITTTPPVLTSPAPSHPRHSWHSYRACVSPVSPLFPITPAVPPCELPA